MKSKHQILWCESQSGFDGRILIKKSHLGRLLKQAGFRYPRIAWDWRYKDHPQIRRQISILTKAGYNSKDISIFVLYNWEVPFREMEKKRIKCWAWRVQIADCRYRPLTQTYDHYNPRKIDQNSCEYYIHSKAGWTDELVKQFRKNVRRQNICIRHGFPFYSRDLECKKVANTIIGKINKMRAQIQKRKILKKYKIAYWFPGEITYPIRGNKNRQAQLDFS